MNAVQSLWLVLTLVASSTATCIPVDCCPEICDLDLDNDICVINGVNKMFKELNCEKCGTDKTLYLNNIERCPGTNIGTINNIEIKGLCNCEVKEGKVDTNKQTYVQLYSCPKLSLTYEFKFLSTVCKEPVQFQVSLTACGYDVKSTISYGYYINEGDNRYHFCIKDVCRKVKLSGEVTFTMKATCGSTSLPLNDPTDEVLQELSLIMKNAMDKKTSELNDLIRAKRMAEVAPALKVDL